MKAETKVKWKMRLNHIKETGKVIIVPLFVGGTIGAAWCGYVESIRNSRNNQKMAVRLEHTMEVVENNAQCQLHDRQTLLEMERQNALLFEKCLKETEGKQESA